MKTTSKIMALGISTLFCGLAIAGNPNTTQTTQTTQTTSTKTTITSPQYTSIIAAASARKDLSTFVRLAKKAGLTDTLQGQGPYTVFIPTNRAFSQLPKATLRNLMLAKNKDKLKSILLYHIVKGNLPSTMVKTGELTTVNGNEIQVMVQSGRVTLDKIAEVTKTDIQTKNGVIHIINHVILPTNS